MTVSLMRTPKGLHSDIDPFPVLFCSLWFLCVCFSLLPVLFCFPPLWFALSVSPVFTPVAPYPECFQPLFSYLGIVEFTFLHLFQSFSWYSSFYHWWLFVFMFGPFGFCNGHLWVSVMFLGLINLLYSAQVSSFVLLYQMWQLISKGKQWIQETWMIFKSSVKF